MDSLIYDNLLIQENEKGEQRMCVIRYKPEEAWYNQADKSLKNFSGSIELYDLQGRSLGKSRVFEGNPVQNKASLAVTECLYELSTTLCTGDIHNPGSYSCTYKYRLKSCTTTLYGDNSPSGIVNSSSYEGSSWNISYGEDGSSITGRNIDDDDIDTTPILPLEFFDNQQKNNLCGSYNWVPVGHASVVNLSGLGFYAKNWSTGASIRVEFSSAMCITLPYTIPQHASGLFNKAWNETMNQVYSYLNATHQVTPVPNSESIKVLIKELLTNNLKNDIHYNASMNTGGCYNVPYSTSKYCT